MNGAERAAGMDGRPWDRTLGSSRLGLTVMLTELGTDVSCDHCK
jgi:hypothetical protein